MAQNTTCLRLSSVHIAENPKALKTRVNHWRRKMYNYPLSYCSSEFSLKLKPCPFCGGEPFDCVDVVDKGMSGKLLFHAIYCQQCSAHGPIYENPERAMKEWNSRSSDKSPSPCRHHEVVENVISKD